MHMQPRCDEPWTEVIYEDSGEGKLTLMVAPLRRLGVNKPTPIEKVGSPESILSSIGPFITGRSTPTMLSSMQRYFLHSQMRPSTPCSVS